MVSEYTFFYVPLSVRAAKGAARKNQKKIKALKWKSLLTLVQDEGITTEKREEAEFEIVSHYTTFDYFIDKIRREPFLTVVQSVRKREVSNYPAAWEKWWAEKDKFTKELEMGRIFHSV